MDEFARYFEPDDNQMEVATALRQQYGAFLRVGFTEEHSIRLVAAMVATVRS